MSNYCMYEAMKGTIPDCDKTCLQDHCAYYYVDPIAKIITEWKTEAKVTAPVLWKFNYSTNELNISTTRPGLLIGLHGRLINKYKSKFDEELYGKIKNIEFTECDDYA